MARGSISTTAGLFLTHQLGPVLDVEEFTTTTQPSDLGIENSIARHNLKKASNVQRLHTKKIEDYFTNRDQTHMLEGIQPITRSDKDPLIANNALRQMGQLL